MPIALATAIIPLALTVSCLVFGAVGAGPRTWLAMIALAALASFVFIEFLKITRELDE
jgi:cell division protein FtsW (lipid II flippase)